MSTNDGRGVQPNQNEKEPAWKGTPFGPLEPWRERADDDSGPAKSATSARPEDPRAVAALETYLQAICEGRPSSRSEVLARYADLAAALDGCFSGLEFVQAAAAELSGRSGESISARDEPGLPSHSQLGDYHILREVGRGGMGVVYEAQQLSLGRRVALKVLPLAAAVDPKQRQRFQIEAQAAAQLHHPHIVPVFGVGCDEGVHYYAMQFVDGQSLSAVIRDLRSDDKAMPAWAEPSVSVGPAENQAARKTPADQPGGCWSPLAPLKPAANGKLHMANPADEPTWDLSQTFDPPPTGPTAEGMVHHDQAFCRKVALLGIEAADALDHAHALGILHRDIKPANLLIDSGGAVWITDFGLARFFGEQSLTGTGDVVGTLRYMSPEQALARRGVVDQRTDIYALGATLYELLTLKPAFGGRDHQELLRQIALDEPIPPSRLNPAVPRDLETIILKAMAKDPSGRYATAQELSEDLKRFLNDDPIMGRRPGLFERSVRWARRRRELVATAASILVLSLLIGTAVTWRYAQETRRHAQVADEARNKYQQYIIRYFPLIDKAADDQVRRAVAMLQPAANRAMRGEADQMFDQVVKMFQEASELPPTDKESRIVIARALSRLAASRSMFGLQKGTGGRPAFELMAAAESDFLRSIALFEKLLVEQAGDPVIRRYMADAVGLGGLGCHMKFTDRLAEAERLYLRAIRIRRDLVRGRAPGDVIGARPRVDDPGERDNPLLLAYTVEIVATAMEEAGRVSEANSMRRELEEDFACVAARFAGPEFQSLRTYWVNQLLMTERSTNIPMFQRIALQYSQLATIVEPNHARAHNNLAWALARGPDEPWFDPKRGLDEARKAVELDSKNGDFWNTLGVAAYRTRDWRTAHDALQRSIKLTGGTPHDWFFLAMTRWTQGDQCEAKRYFDQATAAIKPEQKDDPELRRFHAEAAALLGIPIPNTGLNGGVARTVERPAAPARK